MSQPNAIRYYDGSGIEIFKEFCNCGWLITPPDLAQVIWDSANKHPDIYINCNTIKLYDYTFSRPVLDLAKNIGQLTKIVELCMNMDDRLEDFVNEEEHAIDKFFEDISNNPHIENYR